MNIEKEIKKRAERITISERKFYESQSLKKRLTRTATLLTKRDISVVVTTMVPTARTNGNRIQINPFNELISSFINEKLRFKAMMGMFYHECAHIIYHDFDADKKAVECIEGGTMYGGEPVPKSPEDEDNLVSLKEALLDPAYRKIIIKLYHDITNMFIDNHDENAIIKNYGAEVKYPVLMLRKRLFAVTPFYDAHNEGLEKMTALIFSMARFGKMHGNTAMMKKDPDVQKLLSHQVAIRVGAATDSTYVRYSVINELLLLLWPYIKEKAENSSGTDMDNMSDEDKEKLAEEIMKTLDKLNNEMNSNDSSPTGDSSPETAEKTKDADRKGKETLDKAGVKPASKAIKRKNGTAMTKTDGEEPKTMDSHSTDSNVNTLADADGDSATDTSKPSEESDSDDAGSKSDSSYSSAFDSFSPSDEDNTDSASESEDGNESSEATKSIYDDVADEIKRREAEKELEKEQGDRIKTEGLDSLRDSEWHKGIRLEINRNLEVTDSMRDAYDSVMDADTKKTVRKLVNRIGAVIKETTEDQERRGLSYGNLIFADEAYRRDKKFFGDRRAPSDEPDLALAVLVDESGSMSCSQFDDELSVWLSRWEAARKAATVLYEFATGLDIPVCVTGHTTSGYNTVNYNVFCDFDSVSGLDKYRLMNIYQYEENRDGCAIEMAAAHLAGRPEQIKVLVIISDGEPSHCNANKYYGGISAEEDVKEIVKKWRKKGIEVICFAIGDSKIKLESMYGSSAFIDIKNLNKLPQMMTKIFKKRIEKEL